MQTFLPEGWPTPVGYSHALSAPGRVLALAGQIGWNPLTQQITSGDFVEQARQALQNIATILVTAGARPEQVIRMTWYITNREAYLRDLKGLGSAYRDIFGRHYPAMSVVFVSGLLDPHALLEIEATAIV